MPRPSLAPIFGAFGEPSEALVAHEMFERPGGVIGPIGGEAEFGAGLHDARQLTQKFRLDQAALVVARLRPGIGEKNIDEIKRRIGQTRDHIARVALVQTDVLRAALLDVAQARGNAVQERLDADEAAVGMSGGLGDQVLAAAEADFEDLGAGFSRKWGCRGRKADILGHRREQLFPIQRALLRDGQMRQQRLDQTGLARLEGAGLDAAIASQVSDVRCQVSAPMPWRDLAPPSYI